MEQNILSLLRESKKREICLGQKIEMIFKNFNCDLNNKHSQSGLR